MVAHNLSVYSLCGYTHAISYDAFWKIFNAPFVMGVLREAILPC